MENKIPRSLKDAVPMGPEQVANLIRQHLTICLFQIGEGEDPLQAIKDFQMGIGLDQLPIFEDAA